MSVVCPLCRRATFEPVLQLAGIPVEEGRLAATARAAAQARCGAIALHHCTTCGMVYDAAPRAALAEYDLDYSTFLGHSPSFARHVHDTAARLVQRHRLGGGTVVDIGCGSGDFMAELLGQGMAAGLGIDPAAGEPPDLSIRMVRERFASALMPCDVDLVSCRHMLYMLDDPVGFLGDLRRRLIGNSRSEAEQFPITGGPQAHPGLGLRGGRAVLHLELMNQATALQSSDPWTVTYEHRSYFTSESATRLLQVAGFEPIDVRTRFHDRFLALEARPSARLSVGAGAGEDWSSGLTDGLTGLQGRADSSVREWREAFATVRRTGGRVLGWCAGARAISLLSLTGAGEEVVAVVDVSPERQGRFLPASARPVVAPADASALAPDAVLVTNTAYTDEVRGDLAAMRLDHLPVVELDDPAAPASLVEATR